MKLEDKPRVVISNIKPQVEEGRFATKRIIDDVVIVSADVFTDGNSAIASNLLFSRDKQDWKKVLMQPTDNDRWRGQFTVDTLGVYFFMLQAWIDHFASWLQDLTKKYNAGIDIKIEIEIGIKLLEKMSLKNQSVIKEFLIKIKKAKSLEEQFNLAKDEKFSLLMRDSSFYEQREIQQSKIFSIIVDPPKARFSTWYELFPRSCSSKPNQHGTFKDCEKFLPEIARMGFDVLYLPPIHPIGYSKRKGHWNQLEASVDDPGSPWAIGSAEGGHKSTHPLLGSIKDFENLVLHAKQLGIDIALDIAFQCSPDHPYLKEHPNWFQYRPDGVIQYAENPPKKYEDIVPFNFDTQDWKTLWIELRDIFLYWIDKGVHIFRVDNPHTKPFHFWEWIISTIKQKFPEIIFLSEAFTRPKVMYWLSKLGFTQSYTYFTWRHTKQELTDYFTEIALSDTIEYFRPSLWTNTPDILSQELQQGGRPAFISRFILAATLSSNYGMYAPAYELMEREAFPETEEYLNSEKYQLRHWNFKTDDNLKSLIKQMNTLRKNTPALQYTSNLKFLEIDNDQILYYGKFHPNHALLILINLDSFHPQTGRLKIPLTELEFCQKGSYQVYDALRDRHVIWEGDTQEITLDLCMPAAIFCIRLLA
jgi:starch synthase (maltosyl-transferring)